MTTEPLPDPTFVVTDIEADGPSPLHSSMLSFASVAVTASGKKLGEFEAVLTPRPDRKPDDTTMAWWATQPEAWKSATENPQAPEIVMPALRYFCERHPQLAEAGGLSSGFNLSFQDAEGCGWVSDGNFGLDQGIAVMMIENYRSQFYWKLLRRCAVPLGRRA